MKRVLAIGSTGEQVTGSNLSLLLPSYNVWIVILAIKDGLDSCAGHLNGKVLLCLFRC